MVSRMDTPQSLKNSGLKATLPRRKILELFEASKVRHLSAEDVYGRSSPKASTSASPRSTAC